jgi:type IV pilus assembly protein PilC
MEEAIGKGATLSEAARRESKHLPPLFVELLTAGEMGGRLDVMLRDLADHFEERLAIKRRIIGVMTLPLLELIAAWFLGTFALGLIGNISLDARSTFSIGDYIQGYLQFQGAAMIVAAAAFVGAVFLSRAGMLGWITGALTRVWPLKPVSQRFALARFFKSMSLLIESGLNIRLCIERSAKAAHNPYIERDLLKAVPRVAEGMSLTHAFAVCGSLTPTAREMLEVGEESGALDKSLSKVADYHLAEANQAVMIASRFFGVAIVLLVGLVVGYIVISFYARYFGMLNELM